LTGTAVCNPMPVASTGLARVVCLAREGVINEFFRDKALTEQILRCKRHALEARE